MRAPFLLRRWRSARHASQADASALAGVSQNTWSDWEGGRKTPRTEAALRLHVLTDGAVPVDAWCADGSLAARWRSLVAGERAA